MPRSLAPLLLAIRTAGRCAVAAGLGAGCAVALVPLAHADAAGAGSALEEIVVTAERREASLQEVPLSITAMTGAQLDRSAIQTTQELQMRTPGLVFTTNAALGQPYIRGIGTDIINVGTDPSVAVHVDGIYQTRATASMQDLFDIERVEVVKGPQGTLYGRNATGGAINVIHRAPTEEYEGAVDLMLGNYNKRRVRGMVNAPLVEDRVALRASAFVSERDGYSYDTLRDEELDDEGVWALRTQLRLQMTEDVQLTLAADHMDEDSTRNLAPKVNGALFSPARDVFGAVIGPDEREVTNDHDMYTKLKHSTLAAHLGWDIGELQFKSISGYTDAENDIELDIDATEVDFSWDIEAESVEAFSQEFQLASASDGKLEWILGAFYLHEQAEQNFRIFITPLGASIAYPVENEVDAWALFGQASYSITDTLKFTAGLRHSYEEKAGDFENIVSDPQGLLTGVPGGGVFVTELEPEKDWSAWTPKFGIEYFAAEDVMLYLSATKGFKSGGFNLLGSGEEFDPEFIWSYEAGLKSTLLGQRLRLNLAAFYYDYTDLQVNRFNPATGGATTSVSNAAAAEVTGFEAEVLALLAEGLEFDLGLALLDAEYEDFLSANPDAADPFAEQDLSGNTLPRSPEMSLSTGLQYTHTLAAGGSLTARGEARYQSHIWFDQFNADDVEEDSYWVVNAFLTWQSADQHWRAQAFGRNLSDELYRQSVIRATSLIGTLDFWGPPRTYGVEVGYQF